MSLATEIAGKLNYLNTQDKSTVNALAPYSGYMAWQKDNFYFNTSSSFLASIVDKNRYLKFGDKVVDTYGEELVTNGDFSNGTTGWSLNSGWSITDNQAVGFNQLYGKIYQTINTTIGKSYKLKVNIRVVGGDAGIYVREYNTSGTTVQNILGITSSSTFELDFIATTTSTSIAIQMNSSDGDYYVYNISVREIQTKSAIDYIPEVYVQDQAANGLTTQQSVNAGDYVVVDRKELVTNGTFDSDISGWSAGTWDNGKIKLLTTTSNMYANQQLNGLVSGKVYVLKASVTFVSGIGDIRVGTTSSGTNLYFSNWTINSSREVTVTFIAGSTNWVGINAGNNTEIYFDNISVKQLDEVYRATRDTADMYDYNNDGTSKIVTLNIGDIVYISDPSPLGGGITGHYYKRITSALTYDLSTIPSYNSPTSFIDLGTATNMSLLNPYFEVRDNLPISNQIAFLHTMDATTKAYEGITNEILFNDALAIETPKAIMLKNGFSEVSKGLYSKGSKWYIFAGYWQTLNKGAYHPVFNMAGTRGIKRDGVANDSRTWYAPGGVAIGNVSHTFSRVADSTIYATGSILQINGRLSFGATAYVNSRPDGKFYDIIYPDQLISFESSELAYKPTELEMKEIREYEKFKGVEGLVFTEEKLQITIGSVATLEVNDSTKYVVNQYIQVYGDSTPYRKRIISISGNTLTLDSVFSTSKTASNYIIGGGSIHFNSKGSHLKTGRLGNPTDYEQITKDRLSENRNLFGQISLFIDDNGNSLIPDSVIDTFKVNSKSNTFYNIIRSTDNGTTWTSVTPTSSYITNSLTLTNEPVGNIVLIPYKSQNNPYQATTPKAVLTVEPKVIASNSHSLYKGAITGNCIGKVQVGNGANGFESKVLENSIIAPHHQASTTVVTTFKKYDVIVFDLPTSGIGINGKYYQRIGEDASVFPNSTNYLDTSKYIEVLGVSISTTPQHSTIALDNSNSPASKWFEGLCYDDDYVYPYAVIEELAYNTGTSSYDGDDDKFTQLTNGTLIDLNGNTIVTKFMVGSPIGRRD